MKTNYPTIRTVLLIALLLTFVLSLQPTQARHQMHRGGYKDKHEPEPRMILGFKENLELTEEQVAKLEELNQKLSASWETVKAKKQALYEAIKAQTDEAALRTAATEVGNALGDKAVLKVKAKQQVDALLTDEQKTKLEELKAQRPGLKAKGSKEGKGPGRGDPEEMFKNIDTNGDGVISLDEYKAHAEKMKEHFQQRRQERPGRRRW